MHQEQGEEEGEDGEGDEAGEEENGEEDRGCRLASVSIISVVGGGEIFDSQAKRMVKRIERQIPTAATLRTKRTELIMNPLQCKLDSEVG